MSIEMENPITASQFLLKEDTLEEAKPLVPNKNTPSSSPIDSEKVESLRNQILNNELDISPERIADKMLQLEQDIFNQRK